QLQQGHKQDDAAEQEVHHQPQQLFARGEKMPGVKILAGTTSASAANAAQPQQAQEDNEISSNAQTNYRINTDSKKKVHDLSSPSASASYNFGSSTSSCDVERIDSGTKTPTTTRTTNTTCWLMNNNHANKNNCIQIRGRSGSPDLNLGRMYWAPTYTYFEAAAEEDDEETKEALGSCFLDKEPVIKQNLWFFPHDLDIDTILPKSCDKIFSSSAGGKNINKNRSNKEDNSSSSSCRNDPDVVLLDKTKTTSSNRNSSSTSELHNKKANQQQFLDEHRSTIEKSTEIQAELVFEFANQWLKE
ncbi:unnamed protein product, partial [Amoebophrya sp. A120]